MRILAKFRFVTRSAEVAAPPSGVKSDAVTCWYSLARLHARREGVRHARGLLHVDLALGRVAFLVVGVIVLQSQRNRTRMRLPVLTLSTEVLALTVGE